MISHRRAVEARTLPREPHSRLTGFLWSHDSAWQNLHGSRSPSLSETATPSVSREPYAVSREP